MAKARVSALAKEVGLQSKQLIEWLNNNGEYVKTPSSTIEAPVVAKVHAAFPPVPADEQKPAKKAVAKKAVEEVAAPVEPVAPVPAAPVAPEPVLAAVPPAFAPTEEVFPPLAPPPAPEPVYEPEAPAALSEAPPGSCCPPSRRASAGRQQPVQPASCGQQPVLDAP